MDVTERSVQEIGKSLLITLPKPWANAMRVTRGTKLKIITDERGNLLIAPEFIAKEELHEASIHYDEHIRRHFFREYFGTPVSPSASANDLPNATCNRSTHSCAAS